MNALPAYLKVVTAYSGHMSNQAYSANEAVEIAETAAIHTGKPVRLIDAVTGKLAGTCDARGTFKAVRS